MKKSTPPYDLPAEMTFVRSFQGIDEILLTNGLKVLLFEDPSQANVTVNITYLVGSRHEGRGEAGMAHLLEHMLFRGTTATRDVKGMLQDKGAHFNATTWFDRTNYFETLTPTDDNLEFALKLEADRMINSLILEEDLASEMTVVRNEFEMGESNPTHVLHDQLMSSAYLWHNYGKTTIGNRSDIERVPAKTLRKFYEHYYQPDNAVLVVAGQFDKALAITLINRYFSVIARPSRVLSETYTEEPAQDGPRNVELMRAGDMASVAVGYHVPAASHRDHAAVRIFLDTISDEPAGLIYRELVKTGKTSEAFAMTYALYEPGMGLCFVRPTDDKTAFSVRDELIDLIENRAQADLKNEQIERIKVRILKKIKISLSDSKDLALKLSEAIACGDWRLFFWYRDQIKRVALQDVIRVAKTYFIPTNRTSGVFIPVEDAVRVAIEPAPPIANFIDQVEEDPSLSAGEAFVADAALIEKSIIHKDWDEHRRAGFLSKKTRGQMVRAQIKFRFGNEAALTPYINDFWLIPSLLWRGTKKMDYQAIRDRVDNLMSTLDIDGHAGSLIVSIKSEREHLNEMLGLAATMLKEPAFLPEEFFLARQREIDNYEEIKSDPQRLGFHELERLRHPWPKDSIHYVHTFDEIIDELKTITPERISNAYKTFSLNNFYAGVVGDFDNKTFQDRLIDEFTVDKPALPCERIKRPFIKNLAGEHLCDTKDKEMAIVAYAFNFPMRDDHEDYPSLRLANYIFGETMNSRLMNRIREKEGISYGAGSSIDISRFDENASLSIYAMAAPDAVTRAKRAVVEEWSRFLSEGIDDDELKSAKESIWLNFSNVLGNDGYLVRALSHDLETHRNFLWRERLFKTMSRLSKEDIQKTVQKWWSNLPFSVVVAADLAKVK